VFRPDCRRRACWAVGQLQFEVVAHRLEHEYGVKARIMQQLQPGALGDLRR
jgi:peptide subunit release factor RF-3